MELEPQETPRIRGFLRGSYGTFIQPDYITDFTCDVDGDRATGAVAFRAKGLYRGKVEFTAARAGGRWQIMAFRLPGYQMEVRRAEDGKWTCPKLAMR